ncbi:unnamed protein product [Ixodes persulcatus]
MLQSSEDRQLRDQQTGISSSCSRHDREPQHQAMTPGRKPGVHAKLGPRKPGIAAPETTKPNKPRQYQTNHRNSTKSERNRKFTQDILVLIKVRELMLLLQKRFNSLKTLGRDWGVNTDSTIDAERIHGCKSRLT